MNETEKPLEQPTEGGSYVRSAGGRLVRVASTAPAKPRDRRAAGEPDNPQPAVDPGAAVSAAPVVQLGTGKKE